MIAYPFSANSSSQLLISSDGAAVSVEYGQVSLITLLWCYGEWFCAKIVNKRIECLANGVLNVAGVTHKGAATSGLPINYVEVPYEFEGTFIMMLEIVDRILEFAGEVGVMDQGCVGLEVGEKNMGSLMSARRGVHRGTLVAPCHSPSGWSSRSCRVALSELCKFSITSLASFL